VELLINGGFHNEAIPVLRTITRSILIAYAYANNYCKSLDADLSSELHKHLKADNNLPQDLLQTCYQQYSTSEAIEEIEVKKWLTDLKSLYNFAGEGLTKLAMN